LLLRELEQIKHLPPAEHRERYESILAKHRMAEKKSKNGAGEEDGSGKIKIAFGSVKAADKANSKQSDKLTKMANQQKPQVKPQPQPMQAPQTSMPEQLQAMQQMKHFSGGNQTQHAQ
jgi:hypothetical protein